MKLNLTRAVIAGLLCATCFTTLADPPRKHHATPRVMSESDATEPSTYSTPGLSQEELANAADETVEAATGSDSGMSSLKAGAASQVTDDGQAGALQKTSE